MFCPPRKSRLIGIGTWLYIDSVSCFARGPLPTRPLYFPIDGLWGPKGLMHGNCPNGLLVWGPFPLREPGLTGFKAS